MAPNATFGEQRNGNIVGSTAMTAVLEHTIRLKVRAVLPLPWNWHGYEPACINEKLTTQNGNKSFTLRPASACDSGSRSTTCHHCDQGRSSQRLRLGCWPVSQRIRWNCLLSDILPSPHGQLLQLDIMPTLWAGSQFSEVEACLSLLHNSLKVYFRILLVWKKHCYSLVNWQWMTDQK